MRKRFLLAALASASPACNWVSLAVTAANYQTLRPGDAGNIAVRGTYAYVTLGDSGLGILDARSGARVATLPPPSGSESIDDVAIDGAMLFALDATPPGHVSAWRFESGPTPRQTGPARDAPVGPFSGVSAASGLCVVSGGTSRLTAWRYSVDSLDGPFATADLGRGQPDVLVATDGRTVYVSTHFRGPYFGLNILRLDADSLRTIATLSIDGAGFTPGGAKPANFPIESALLDDATLLVAFRRGLAVIDVHDAARPFVRRVVNVGGPAVNVDVSAGTAAVAVSGGNAAVALVPFSGGEPGPVRPTLLAPGTNPGGVAFSDSSVLVAARGKGVLRVRR